jgi:hypothetical protein
LLGLETQLGAVTGTEIFGTRGLGGLEVLVLYALSETVNTELLELSTLNLPLAAAKAFFPWLS